MAQEPQQLMTGRHIAASWLGPMTGVKLLDPSLIELRQRQPASLEPVTQSRSQGAFDFHRLCGVALANQQCFKSPDMPGQRSAAGTGDAGRVASIDNLFDRHAVLPHEDRCDPWEVVAAVRAAQPSHLVTPHLE